MFGVFLALPVAIHVGRLVPLRVGYAVVILTAAALFVCLSDGLTFATTILEKLALGFVQGIIWILMPESFPTNVRSTAVGFILATGKLGAAVSVGLVYAIFYVEPVVLVGVFFGVSIFGFAGTFFRMQETKNLLLQDTSP